MRANFGLHVQQFNRLLCHPLAADMTDDDNFGTRQPPLTDFIKNLLQRYTDGGEILKVS